MPPPIHPLDEIIIMCMQNCLYLDLDILGDLDLDLELRDLRPLPPDFLAARFRFITFRTSYLGRKL